MTSSDTRLHDEIDLLRREVAALRRRNARGAWLGSLGLVAAGALLSWAALAASETGAVARMQAPFEVIGSKGETLGKPIARIDEEGLRLLDKNGDTLIVLNADGAKLHGEKGGFLQLAKDRLEIIDRAGGTQLLMTAEGVGTFSGDGQFSLSQAGLVVGSGDSTALLGEGEKGNLRLAFYQGSEGSVRTPPAGKEPWAKVASGVGGTLRVGMGIVQDAGNGVIHLNDARGERIVGLEASVDGGGSVAVFKDTPQPLASLAASADGGQVVVHGADGTAIASLSRAKQGGMFQLTDFAGEVMVEAGTIDGIGIARAGPAAQPGGLLGMGLPGSYIMGKKAQ